MSDHGSDQHLIIVSNRLPIVLEKTAEDHWDVKPGSGGLVTALAPVLKNRGGIWIGWPGIASDEHADLDRVLSEQTKNFGYRLKSVNLTATEQELYYEGFSNEIIWPLFHDIAAYCNFNPEYWKAYRHVNQKFATVVKNNLGKSDFIWVQDYQLMEVAMHLREMGVTARIAFFLHIPFPPLDIFVRLPWRFQILHALIEYDVIGFQTLRDRRNFLQCAKTLLREVSIVGRGQVVTIRFRNREIRVGAFAISIDFNEFAKAAAGQKVAEKAWYIHEHFKDQQTILGIDRLDYSKGILERLKGYRNALARYPELQKRTTFNLFVVPSRRNIPQYASLKTDIERLVGAINGEYTRSGWVPIHYFFRSLNRTELLAYYRMSEIALLTPLKDGMNLVAKEYCASKIEENGVLILSEFAGAAAQFQKHALLVNPHDIEGIADTIYRAFQMSREERESRMRGLRQIVRKYNIFWWVDSFLKAAFAKDLRDFPLMEDYIPQEQPEITDAISA
jgi:trehalose 6-phosphate synthase